MSALIVHLRVKLFADFSLRCIFSTLRSPATHDFRPLIGQAVFAQLACVCVVASDRSGYWQQFKEIASARLHSLLRSEATTQTQASWALACVCIVASDRRRLSCWSYLFKLSPVTRSKKRVIRIWIKTLLTFTRFHWNNCEKRQMDRVKHDSLMV